ncbi:MAG: hypothetical protein ACRDN0_29305, partial [Trebonia sp.]
TFGYAMPVTALALHLPVVFVALAALLAGTGSAVGGALGATVMQQRVPASSLSRVGAFEMVGAFAFGPVAFIAAGPAAALIGARTVLGVGAAWSVFGTLVMFAIPSIRHIPWLNSPPAPDPAPPVLAASRDHHPASPNEQKGSP